MWAAARWKPILFQKEREWINSTLFVFEHDGNLWRGIRPTPTLSRSRWLQHDAKIRPRQILRGSKRKKREGWKDEVKRHENSSRERSMWRKCHRAATLSLGIHFLHPRRGKSRFYPVEKMYFVITAWWRHLITHRTRMVPIFRQRHVTKLRWDR